MRRQLPSLAPIFIGIVLALAMGGGCGGDGGDPTSTMRAADAAADCMPTKHPGKVEVVNQDSGTTEIVVVTADNEADWWRMTPGGRVPVVKSVYHSLDKSHAEITLYGPCGQVLEVILGMK